MLFVRLMRQLYVVFFLYSYTLVYRFHDRVSLSHLGEYEKIKMERAGSCWPTLAPRQRLGGSLSLIGQEIARSNDCQVSKKCSERLWHDFVDSVALTKVQKSLRGWAVLGSTPLSFLAICAANFELLIGFRWRELGSVPLCRGAQICRRNSASYRAFPSSHVTLAPLYFGRLSRAV